MASNRPMELTFGSSSFSWINHKALRYISTCSASAVPIKSCSWSPFLPVGSTEDAIFDNCSGTVGDHLTNNGCELSLMGNYQTSYAYLHL